MPVSYRSYRVPAGSLMITVIISLVIGLICSFLILLAYNNLLIRTDLRVEDKLNRNLHSAVNLVLEDDPAAGDIRHKQIDLFGEGNDSVYVQEELWGVYDVASIEARDGKRTKQRSFFFGALLPDSLDGCLYLAEHQRSLSLVGATRLTGKAHLPKAGIKAGYIDQRGYDNTELVSGATVPGMDSLPALRQSFLRYYTTLIGKDSSGRRMSLLPDSLDRPFADSLFTLYGKGAMVLSGISWSGHILVLSDSSIEVDADAHLENVILSAPVIRFKKGFSGRVQAYGSDSVVVESNCTLAYPSSLVLVKKNRDNGQPRLMIYGDCMIEGLVLSVCEGSDVRKTYVEIGTNTLVRGILYANGYLCLKGLVYGATLTDYFIYRTPAVIYENYLVDAVLDRSRLASWFTGPVIFNDRRKNKVMQWVN